MGIRVITGFEGSCPHFDEGVRKTGEDSFLVYPSYRKIPGIDEEAPGAGGRFYIRIENPSNNGVTAKIIADWETPKRVKHHDYGFIRTLGASNSDWKMIPGILRDETKVEYNIEVAHGIIELALLPQYNCSDLQNFIAGIGKKGFHAEVAGKSGEGRDLFLLSSKSGNANAKNFFIQARDHAYESAGSFCVEGIVDFLASDDPVAAYLNSKFNFQIMPMTNPDGVYNGLSRLTHENGLNLDRIYWNEGAGPEVGILLRNLDIIKPAVYMNIHNWAFKFIDGILAADQDIAETIPQYMPNDAEHLKKWKIDHDKLWCERNNVTVYRHDFKGSRYYCKEKFDSIAAVFEFPWFARTTGDMRKKGVQALTALALISIEKLKI